MTEERRYDIPSILTKIRALLALAEKPGTEGEAQAAIIRAQELMAKYGVTERDAEEGRSGEGKGRPGIADVELGEPSGATPWWHKELAVILSKNFRCEAIVKRYAPRWGDSKGKTRMAFLGLKEDAEVAATVYMYALESIKSLSKRHVQALYRAGRPTKGIHNDFIQGFLDGLAAKLAEQVKQNKWEIVLATGSLVLAELARRAPKKFKQTGFKPGFAGDNGSYKEGYRHGRSFEPGATRPDELKQISSK
jgi:hypothetical protein